MLPITNLHACNCIKQSQKLGNSIPVGTFNQQLYIKAYEIVPLKKMKVFLRLGRFHLLTSFSGLTDTLMEGSGMRTALESLYAPITVGPMMTVKAYSQTIHGHFPSISSLLSILIVEFWTNLNHKML